MGESHGVLEFLFATTDERILVYDGQLSIAWRNPRAAAFLSRYELPPEIPALAARIIAAVARGAVGREFPGRIGLSREIDGRRWSFRVVVRDSDEPLVCVFFRDETVSGRFDLNAVRGAYRLTRREVDLLSHLLDGMGNREIAEDLGISEQTVKEHLGNVYRKVGVKDRYDLLRKLVANARP